ncbi:hypothetical protein AAVH_16065 [Aphelenchoides avenae]|nr:hypothetical protein AAVH_16065 [Aphelenchus avenae]
MIQSNKNFVYDCHAGDCSGLPGMYRPTVGPTSSKDCTFDHFVYSKQFGYRPENYFCCRCHVETGANMIVLLGVIFSVAPFAGSLAVGSLSGVVGAAVNAFVCTFLLVANSTRNGIFYVPFLMLNAIGFILFPLIPAVYVVGAATVNDEDLKNAAEFFCLAFAICAGPV